MRKPFFLHALWILLSVAMAFFLHASVLKEECGASESEIHVPEVEFAGKKILLSRQDLFERYDRERLACRNMHTASTLLIKRAPRYFAVIEPLLAENGIPDDFKYLAAIESTFNPRAVSLVKAAGIWQFMEETGKQYGLEINEEVDERFHVEKSTVAACRYLKDAYQKFGDWMLVAASYNAGMGRLEKELSEQKCSEFFDLYLNEETSRYVVRILLAKQLLNNPSDFGFSVSETEKYPVLGYREVKVNGSVDSWPDFAAVQQCSYAQLKEANLWICGKKMLNKRGKTYVVKIPEIHYLDGGKK